MANYADLAKSVIEGQKDQVLDQVKALIAAGNNPLEIVNEGLIAGMNVVGVRFKAGDMYVPEVLMAAKSMSSGLELVKPLIAAADQKSKGKILLGTVKGDLHDIGKNLVGMLIESGGLEVINMGVDVSAEDFIDAIIEHEPDILALSALLTTTMPAMQDIIEMLEEEELRDKVKVIIGGAPVSQEYADTIGADGYGADAGSAVELCKRLLASK
ncbi:B12-binding domain-containing protein [Desulfosporosinus sp. BICA1-9]|uniref:cobalamin B12-binding domain-containing protein n=1 Tax=Desulfosporosinus sp. BICA1-9 TaxID=1531958 RepID=UPI00054C02D0|nr:corrinoid protein [Desulfosporosinus sp. BICA1-9]KJS46011.1 MAG: methyltransferase [Peptococcaceae bacterium BRH_c23]KJS80318.1 MAG: methyltransferase [Desulfosporosinus sp. BICA1-9]HBW37626.1 cobalamin-binding protein [Desulfosporosinus sp.]